MGRSEVLQILDATHAEGVDVTCDQYSYDTTDGGLAAGTLQYSDQSGKTTKHISEALRMPAIRGSIKEAVAISIHRRGGPGALTIPTYPADLTLEGRTAQEIRAVLRLEEAIRKMTSFPAQRFSQKERGAIAKGMWADIVILDADAVRDATFEHPKRYPAGIPSVMVNGTWVIKDNEFARKLPGVPARRR